MRLPQVKPHVLQGNVWSVVYDPALMNVCRDNDILFQVANIALDSTRARGWRRTHYA